MSRLFLYLLLILLIRFAFFYTSTHTFVKTQKAEELSIFVSIREKIGETYYRTLPQDDAALLIGIVLGVKGDFNKEYFEAIRNTGVLHVIAASGMNVSMVTAFLLASLILFFKRQTSLILACVCIIFYCGLAGFQPSIVRAGIMALFAIGAGIIGRQNTSVLALLFAAFLMLMFDPTLLTSIGFQLSFAATAGIILIDPILKKLNKKILFDDFRTTFAAQIATTPILLFYFGSYSPISIITNLLIFWTIPPLMILGSIASLFSLTIPLLAKPFLLLSLPILTYFKEIVLFTNGFAVQVDLESIPWTIVIGYYMILLGLIVWTYKRKDIKI